MPPRLRVLSFNIQVGLHTAHYGHYITRAWRHALPGRDPHAALDRVAELIRDYDFVAIQEADAGSLRTRSVDQMAYLAQRAGFPHHGLAITRDLKPFARHALGYLSRHPARIIGTHDLPGPIPGRRALQVEVGAPGGPIEIVVTHLSLTRGTRDRQLHHLIACIAPEKPSLIMGDLNAESSALREHPALKAAGFWLPDDTPATFPSWSPRRSIDHILLSSHMDMHRLETLPPALSDHLPLAAEVSVRAPSA